MAQRGSSRPSFAEPEPCFPPAIISNPSVFLIPDISNRENPSALLRPARNYWQESPHPSFMSPILQQKEGIFFLNPRTNFQNTLQHTDEFL